MTGSAGTTVRHRADCLGRRCLLIVEPRAKRGPQLRHSGCPTHANRRKRRRLLESDQSTLTSQVDAARGEALHLKGHRIVSKSDPLERAFMLIDIMASAGRDLPLSEIVEISGLPQSSTFRLCANLVESGMLAANPVSKTFSIGARAQRLALYLHGRPKLENLLTPPLEAIARRFEETSLFVQHGSGRNNLLLHIVPEIGGRSFIHPGFDFPAHATATGKVICAFGSSSWDDVIGQPLERFREETVTDRDKLIALFESVRQQGFAENDGELDAGVYSAAAPIFLKDILIGAIGLVAPSARVDKSKKGTQGALPKTLVEEARKISGLLSL